METLEIAQNEHSLFVHVNKISAGNRKIDELLGYLQNLFLDDSHIPSVRNKRISKKFLLEKVQMTEKLFVLRILIIVLL